MTADFLRTMVKIGKSRPMATKADNTSASERSSKKVKADASGKKRSASTSRKTVRKTTAAYARRTDDGDDEDDGRERAAPSEAGAEERAAVDGTDGSGSQQKTAGTPTRKAIGQAADKAPGRATRPSRPPAEPPPGPDQTAPSKARSATPARPSAPPRPAARPSAPPAPAEQPSAPAPMVPASEFAELLPPQLVGQSDPQSPAPPPGKAPPGDSRSFRRIHDGVEEFVLIYRYESFLITRAGHVGMEGTWKVVEYPHIGSAAHAYAQQCSELTGAGYRDLR